MGEEWILVARLDHRGALARGGHITRVETLGGKYLYAIKVFTSGESFNLCPADICQTTDGVELARTSCPIDAPRSGLQVESYTPPAQVIAAVETIVQAAEIDVGGVEYIVDDRDGSLLYYDINALSNFVADAPNVIGFDPFVNLVDYLERRTRETGDRRQETERQAHGGRPQVSVEEVAPV